MSRVYKNKQDYIETLAKTLEVRDDFKSLEYRRNRDGNEYLILTSIAGDVFMFDITGYSEAQIYHTLAIVECGYKPRNFIKDRNKRTEIGRLCV